MGCLITGAARVPTVADTSEPFADATVSAG